MLPQVRLQKLTFMRPDGIENRHTKLNNFDFFYNIFQYFLLIVILISLNKLSFDYYKKYYTSIYMK